VTNIDRGNWVYDGLTLDYAQAHFDRVQWSPRPPDAIATIEYAVSDEFTGCRFHAVWWWKFADNPDMPFGGAGFTEFKFLDTAPTESGYRVLMAAEPDNYEYTLPVGTIVTIRRISAT
jgi:hypothetical protein